LHPAGRGRIRGKGGRFRCGRKRIVVRKHKPSTASTGEGEGSKCTWEEEGTPLLSSWEKRRRKAEIVEKKIQKPLEKESLPSVGNTARSGCKKIEDELFLHQNFPLSPVRKETLFPDRRRKDREAPTSGGSSNRERTPCLPDRIPSGCTRKRRGKRGKSFDSPLQEEGSFSSQRISIYRGNSLIALDLRRRKGNLRVEHPGKRDPRKNAEVIYSLGKGEPSRTEADPQEGKRRKM